MIVFVMIHALEIKVDVVMYLSRV